MLQSLPLDIKIAKSKQRIRETINEFGIEHCYVSYSGGKDSEVMSHLIMQEYPEILHIFANTTVEYPETYERVREKKNECNLIKIKPKMNFKQVVEKYGYPMFSKKIAGNIRTYRNARSQKVKENSYKYMKKHREKYIDYLDCPFSDMCCSKLKHGELQKYSKKNGYECSFVGMMAEESQQRKDSWLSNGCNAFGRKGEKQSRPLMFWTEKDIWDYISFYNLKVNKLYSLGYKRNGCMYCGFGVQHEFPINRIQRLSQTHLGAYQVFLRNYSKYFDMTGIDYKHIQISMF
nr:phosphoadenosine phosphosulfate reductase family protein [Tissierella simiarum]